MSLVGGRRRSGAEGFSLVELAIVIVIIGLILSSVLVGQDIIRAAELRAVTTDITNTKTAVQTFVAKYGNKLPGDIKDPGNYNLPVCGTAGDGDGLIEDGTGGRAVLSGEVLCFWQHLGSPDPGLTTKTAELISGTYNGDDGTAVAVGSHLPQVRGKSSGLGVFTDGLDNYLVAGVLPGANDAYDTAATFSPEDGKDIDEKIDDGNPLTGAVLARDDSPGDPMPAPVANTVSTCYDVGTGDAAPTTPDVDDRYMVPNETPQCALLFKMPQL